MTEELILERRCHRTTLQDILQKAGVSKGAIYHYVNSKDELFALILKQKLVQVDERFNKKLLLLMTKMHRLEE
ncbi:TetR/AcrR family transcriptional regulator [Seinonella peptonophila]|uniref:TetR/AcrR family transcriptional regulator n=1 Tax=Seinonella peptonophila TaxID=112248 RepID=UPI0009FD5BCF|nr:helix-turn-helix domain-containing protein [Seinonella peptonophila]